MTAEPADGRTTGGATTAHAAPTATRVDSHLRQATARLGGTPEAAREARLLLATVLGRSEAWLYAWPEAELDSAQTQRFHALIAGRAAGQPIAYLTGRRAFWSLELCVSPDTLIPRPETELLVEWAIELASPEPTCRILELGTGSGAIALALAATAPGWQLTAVDSSPAALSVARANARRLGLHNLQWCASDWFAALAPWVRFPLILANPPYLASDDPHLQQGDLRFEPRAALASGPAGLDALQHIIRTAPRHLAPGGHLLLEHGWTQGPAVRDCLQQAGFTAITTRTDLAGHERASGGRWPPSAPARKTLTL